MKRLQMEKYYINRETANISALSSGKTDKYEYFAGEQYRYLIKVGNRAS